MAITISRDKLPEVGDVVSKVEIDDDGSVADVRFESGRWVAVHLTPEKASAPMADKDPTEKVKSG